MEDTVQEVTRKQVVKEYMAACTESFKEKTILSAWRKSGILPFDPGRFTSHDFGPSVPSSFKAPLPKSFSMPPTDPELYNDNHSVDKAPHSSPIQYLNALAQPYLPLHEGGEPQLRGGPQGDPPNCMSLPPLLSTTHNHHLCSQTHTLKPTSLDEWLTASEMRIKELEHEGKRVKELECKVERLGTYCVLSRGMITQLLKWVNTKENKKKTAAHAKKTTREARVLTSEEGHEELQQLHEESCQKELHQINELAQKAAEDLAQHKCRADPTHIFTGLLNKSWCKEELADIAAALSLLDSGKKDDIFERIMAAFDENPGLKTNPHFKGLFHSHPQKQACHDDGAPVAGPSNPTSTPSKSLSPPIIPPSTMALWDYPIYTSSPFILASGLQHLMDADQLNTRLINIHKIPTYIILRPS